MSNTIAILLVEYPDGTVRESMGSDGCVPIDGRYGSLRIAESVRSHAKRVRKVYPAVGFNLYRNGIGSGARPTHCSLIYPPVAEVRRDGTLQGPSREYLSRADLIGNQSENPIFRWSR